MRVTGKVKTIGGSAAKVDATLAAAQSAVKKFEGMRAELESMKDDFESQFPDAVAELQAIKKFEDDIREHIESTKLLVRDAKETVGEFKLQRRFKKAGYDVDKMLEIMGELSDWEMLYRMAEQGAVKTITLDQSALTLMFDYMPNDKERYSTAWKDKEETTPAVTVPKI